MTKAYINAISTAVPPQDIHKKFVSYAPQLLEDDRTRKLFKRMADRAQIDHRYSFLSPHHNDGRLDTDGFYQPERFPDTATRMRFYQKYAFELVRQALDQIPLPDTITHIITTTCTGFYSPGIDLQIIEHYHLNPAIERTAIGFMGCYAAMNALRLARHIVRSDASAQVLVVNLELCTLHLQQPETLEQLLSFLIFADGCAATLVSAKPAGLELQDFNTTLVENSKQQITWDIGNSGFDMVLSGEVPNTISSALPTALPAILHARPKDSISHWAVHPGGRSVLDAVASSAELAPELLQTSRDILRRYGNMSSATVMFVLREMMRQNQVIDQGVAMAFGPGVMVESMLFKSAGPDL